MELLNGLNLECSMFNGNLLDRGTIDSTRLFSSYGTKSNIDYVKKALRPIVEIDLSKVNIGLTGNGSSDSPYSIEAK